MYREQKITYLISKKSQIAMVTLFVDGELPGPAPAPPAKCLSGQRPPSRPQARAPLLGLSDALIITALSVFSENEHRAFAQDERPGAARDAINRICIHVFAERSDRDR